MRIVNFCKVLILVLLFFTQLAFAQDKILIVNSDDSVHRYAQILSTFKGIIEKNAYRWIDFNAAGYDDPDAELKKIIQQENPDIIYCIGSKAYSLAHSYAKVTTVVFSAVINWRRLPTENKTYGVANELSPSQEMSLMHYFFPNIKKVGIIYSSVNHEYTDTIRKDAASLGVQLIDQQAESVQELDGALETLLPKIDMLWVISDPGVLENKEAVERVFQAAKQQQKIVYAYSDVLIKYGAVLALSADTATIGRQSANLILMLKSNTNNKIPPGTVQIPAGSDIVLNMCTIDKMQIKFNKDALDSVNKITNCNELNNE